MCQKSAGGVGSGSALVVQEYIRYFRYGKCPKISDTKISDKMVCAKNADPDQNAPDLKAKFKQEKRYGIKCSKF